jgi:hypothetical protein
VKDSKVIVDALLGDEADPKDMASNVELGSDAFQEVMQNFEKHMHDLVKKAQASGALSGDEPEHLVLKCLLVIAANDFYPGHIVQFKKTLKNLQRFL